MDPITLIVTALAAGAAAGMRDTASSVVKDAYTGLKALVRKGLSGSPDGELVLARHEQAPETWRAPLAAVLDEAGAGNGHKLRVREALPRPTGCGSPCSMPDFPP